MFKKLPYFIFVSFFFVSAQKTEAIIFEEHFNGNELNENQWNYELGDGCPKLCGWGNEEWEYYTKESVSVSEGNLVITASKVDDKYFSGRINTRGKVEFQYGTIEVKAKLPTGKGVWPAIWMLGNDIKTVGWPACGEIDIMEYAGKSPELIHTTLHTSDSFGKSKNTKVSQIEAIENGFHVYKSNWTKDKIEFFIDDRLVYVFEPQQKNIDIWPFNKPFYVILNLAIGGTFAGQEVDESIFPQEFLIDYIKIYKN
jgi:beta-glucanase (GH16 family)